MAGVEFVLKNNVTDFKRNNKAARDSWRKTTREMKTDAQGLGRTVEQQTQQINASVAASVKRIGLLGAAIAAAAGGKATVNAYADFETGLIGVGKTADIEGKRLKAFGDDIQALAKEIPVTTSELLELAGAAGQLGVKGEANLLNFSRVLAELASASDVQGEEGARSIVRILGITNEDISQVDQFSNVLVGLGNNIAATESEILGVATRVAQGTAAFKLSSNQILGISGGIKALGVEAELAGSTTQKAFIKLQEAIQNGGEEMAVLQQITGKTREELEKLFAEDQAALFDLFIKGLNGVNESGGNVIKTLSALGLEEIRSVSVLSTLAKGYDTYAKAISTAEREAKKNNARSEEANKAFASLNKQIEAAKNSASILLQETGELIAPFVVSGLGSIEEKFNKISSAINKVNKALQDSDSFVGSTAEKLSILYNALDAVDDFVFNDFLFFSPLAALINSLDDAGKQANTTRIDITKSFGTIIDLEKGLAKQATITAKAVKSAAETQSVAIEKSVNASLRAIDKQIDKLKESAASARQFREDLDAALANIGKVDPSKATDATNAIVNVRNASLNESDPENTIKLGKEALQIIEQLRSDGVIDDRLAKAQLQQLKDITKNAADQVEAKAEADIQTLEAQADKLKSIEVGLDSASVERAGDQLVKILSGKLSQLKIPGFDAAATDPTNNIIKDLSNIKSPPQLGDPVARNIGKQSLDVKLSADKSASDLVSQINKIFNIDGNKLVEQAVLSVFGKESNGISG